MNDFTASNGIEISVTDGASGTYLLGRMPTYECADQTHATGSTEGIQALREFFQAEADDRLSRWRDPEDPVFYVYSGGAWDGIFSPIRIVAETNGASWLLDRDDHEPSVPPKVLAVARRFFDAHPEPKPWHDAKPGEVWVFHISNAEPLAAVSTQGNWIGAQTGLPVNITSAKSARRIFPEVS